MNDIFHSIMKSAPNVIIYHQKLYDFKTDFLGSGIDDLCSKISWMRGVGWPDEKNISDLDQKLIISTWSVFSTQSRQICRAELENYFHTGSGHFLYGSRRSVFSHFKSSTTVSLFVNQMPLIRLLLVIHHSNLQLSTSGSSHEHY